MPPSPSSQLSTISLEHPPRLGLLLSLTLSVVVAARPELFVSENYYYEYEGWIC